MSTDKIANALHNALLSFPEQHTPVNVADGLLAISVQLKRLADVMERYMKLAEGSASEHVALMDEVVSAFTTPPGGAP